MTEQLKQRPGDQPLPTEGEQYVFDELIRRLTERSDIGFKRYGRRLQTFNGRDPQRDALEEILDLFAYHMQAQLERDATHTSIYQALLLHRDDMGLCRTCAVPSPCSTRNVLIRWADVTGLEGHPLIEQLHAFADRLAQGCPWTGNEPGRGEELRALLPRRAATQAPAKPAPLEVIHLEDPEEVACAPDAIEELRTNLGIQPSQTGLSSPLGEYLGFPVVVDPSLRPRTIVLRPRKKDGTP